MRKTGLSNRFNSDEKYVWQWWWHCMWCGENRWDALHHIMSPSSMRYVKGDHNSSILNSCPIHNSSCHLYNSLLHDVKYERKLLLKTYEALLSMGYKLKDKDRKFMEVYDFHFKYVLPQNQEPSYGAVPSTDALLDESC